MTENSGLWHRVGAMLRSAFERVLADLQANPVASVVVGAATAISYESLYNCALAVGVPWVLALLFPLVLDVAAFPALTIVLSSVYGFFPRCFALLVSLAALAGSVYGNLANHLAKNAPTRPELADTARDWAWTVLGTVGDGRTAINSPSLTTIVFVSVSVPLAIATTLVLLRFRPKAANKTSEAANKAPEVANRAPEAPLPPATKRKAPEVSTMGETLADRMTNWVRNYHAENGELPTPSQVDKGVPNKSRNGAKAVARVRKELGLDEDAV